MIRKEGRQEITKIKAYLRAHLSVLIFMIALILAFTNYLLYPAYLNKRFELIEVPIVARDLPPSTKITEEQITFATFPSKALKASIYLDSEELIGKYVKDDMTLIEGGFFYKQQLCADSSMVNDYDLETDEYAYSIIIAENSGLLAQLKDQKYIDLFFQANREMDESKLMIGKLMEHAKIIDIVADDNALEMVISVKEEDIDILIAATSLGKILPYIGGQSHIDDYSGSTIYDVQATRQLIQTRLYDLRYHDLGEVGNDN